MSVLSISNISKSYGRIRALNEVSFEVPEGSVFGILGPNGSGKTTLLGIVMDVLRANGGTYSWFGHAGDHEQRKQIGTLLETPNFYHYLSGYRNLCIAAEIKGKGYGSIEPVLKQVNLYDRRDSKFSTYSLGMKQRLALAAALLGNPKVLVLDEPTNGLDPVGIADTRELIQRLAQEGKTIILASHLLDEVEKVCTHVAILQKGRMLTNGKVDDVLRNEDIVELGSANNALVAGVMQHYPGVQGIKPQASHLHVLFPNNTARLDDINRHCFEQGIVLNHLQLKKKSLETRFFELTSNAGSAN